MNKFISVSRLFLPVLIATLTTPAALALEVDREVMPRIQLGGRIMASVDMVDLDSDPNAETNINLADSSLLARFDKRMYGGGVAGATVGFAEYEDAVVFHQLNGFYWNRDYAVMIGRGRLRNTLLELPLMRDDDLLDYTHVGNASSDEEFDQVFGEQLAFDLFLDKKIQRVGLWTGTRRNDTDIAYANAPGGFDSFGASYIYEQPEDLLYVKRLRHAGLMIDAQQVETTTGDEWSTALTVGAEVNLNIDPTHSWSLAGQAIMNQGVDGLPVAPNLAANDSTSMVVSLRHTNRPMLLTRSQLGLTFAYKDYADIPDGSQWSVVGNIFYRLGQGVDLLAQLSYTDYDDGLGGGDDTVLQVGMAFSFDAMFNDNIGERDSILNLEHGYIQ
ncbi:MAG: hypothetical protein KAU29_03365 [Gammaproteobacteria bacterium]|nr:hypothetical protein [Gammaproteobacteria bacterium]